ncbi:hypothetical protein A4244_13330 [Bacillus badius]|nr:hypothetical protein A4244_13330 [Bacillus badius]OCS89420.1 hypothetical protein A6M11_13350 [Bacillus badius]OVE51201.1 hypothetical protein B1A98_12520 [Bacillus badius]
MIPFSNKHHYTTILFLCTLLIGMEGAQTPAGSPPAPRKAKRLEWKATEPFHKQTKKDCRQTSIFIGFVYSLKLSSLGRFFLFLFLRAAAGFLLRLFVPIILMEGSTHLFITPLYPYHIII